MATIELDIPDYLPNANDVETPITGYGPYHSKDLSRFEKMIIAQSIAMKRLQQKERKLKRKLAKLHNEIDQIKKQGKLTYKQRAYVQQLELTIASATSAIAENAVKKQAVQQGDNLD